MKLPSLETLIRSAREARPEFTVRSAAQGLRLIEHPAITDNHERSLRVRPSHRTAVLLPCAGTKPFPEAPSHKHGYLPALQGAAVDVYVVAEPLGVVPYDWSTRWPNNAYDFPPKHLRGPAFDLLADRVRQWLQRVGQRYERIVLALPQHHMRLVQAAANGLELPLVDASLTACRAQQCPAVAFRATHPSYRRFLRSRVRQGSAKAKTWAWLPLDVALAAEPAMKRRGVSKVARSKRGFLRAYEAAGGKPSQLGLTPQSTPNRAPYPWTQRRAEFVSRHMGQIRANNEALWQSDGSPTRRHLGLIAWAYSPEPARLRKWLAAEQGSRAIKLQGVTFPDLDLYFGWDQAVEELRHDVAWWVYRGAHKASIFHTYEALTPAQKAGLRFANLAVLGEQPITLYRLMKGTQRQGLGGASFTDVPDLFPNAVAFEVRPQDVLVFYGTPGFDGSFGGKTYGHEREYILLPQARPRRLE
jgi:hypothetical protein